MLEVTTVTTTALLRVQKENTVATVRIGGLVCCCCCRHRFHHHQYRTDTCIASCAPPWQPWSWHTYRGTTSRRCRSRSRIHRGRSSPRTSRKGFPHAHPHWRHRRRLPAQPGLPPRGGVFIFHLWWRLWLLHLRFGRFLCSEWGGAKWASNMWQAKHICSMECVMFAVCRNFFVQMCQLYNKQRNWTANLRNRLNEWKQYF